MLIRRVQLMTSGKPQFHTFYSNSYEALRQVLQAMLTLERRSLANAGTAKVSPGFFAQIPVITSSRLIESDLMRSMAENSASGIASGVRMMSFGDWYRPIAGQFLGQLPETTELNWLIWTKLLDSEFVSRHKGLLNYLTESTDEDGTVHLKPQNDLSRFELAGRIGSVFGKYVRYRFDWIRDWIDEKGGVSRTPYSRRKELDRQFFENPEHAESAAHLAWQKEIWQWLSEKDRDEHGYMNERWRGIRSIRRLEERFRNLEEADFPDEGLPLHVFIPKELPPLALPILYEKSLKDPVYLYLLNPSDKFWFDPLLPAQAETAGKAQPGCSWLSRNAGQTRAVMDRVYRFASGEAMPEVEDDLPDPESARPKTEDFRFNPSLPMQDIRVSIENGDTRLTADPAVLAGHGTAEEPAVRTLLDAVHEAVRRDDTAFLLQSPEDGSEHELLLPQELEAYQAGEKGLPSVCIFPSPSLKREAEGLADWIYALGRKGIKPSEILVVTPDIEKTAPVVSAVFSSLPESIPYAVSGMAPEGGEGVAKAFCELGDFLAGSGNLESLLKLLSSPAIAAGWNFGPDELSLAGSWLLEAGFRYGISESHIRHLISEGIAADEGDAEAIDTTLFRAAERLALGAAADTESSPDRVWQDVRAVTGSDQMWRSAAGNPALLDAILVFSEALDEAQQRSFPAGSEKGQSPAAWEKFFAWLSETFFSRLSGRSAAAELGSLRTRLTQICGMVERSLSGMPDEEKIIPYQVIWKAVKNVIASESLIWWTGGKTVLAPMMPDQVRMIPFRAIAVIGLNSDSGFPGTMKLDEFDLMGEAGLKRRGDGDSRRDNRNIFFDLVMAAREHFAVFYNAGASREKPLMPSEVVTDFEEFLEELRKNALAGSGIKPENAGNFWRFRYPLAFTSHARQNYTEEAAAAGLTGSSREVYDILLSGKTAGPLPDFAEGAEHVRIGSAENRISADDLAAYLSDPEKTVMKLLDAAAGSEADESRTVPLSWEPDGLESWAFRRDALRAFRKGETPEDFIAPRLLDPVYGLRTLRKDLLLPEAERLWQVFGLEKELLAGRIKKLYPGCAVKLSAGEGGLAEDWEISCGKLTLHADRENSILSVFGVSGRDRWRAMLLSLFFSAAAEEGESVPQVFFADVKKIEKEEEEAAFSEFLVRSPQEARELLARIVRLYEAAVAEASPLASGYVRSPFYREETEKQPLVKSEKSFEDELLRLLRGRKKGERKVATADTVRTAAEKLLSQVLKGERK